MTVEAIPGSKGEGDRRLKATVSAHVILVERTSGGEERILLTQLAYRDQRNGKWCFPGGFVDAGETLEMALRREVMEEIGVRLHSVRQVAVVPLFELIVPNIGFLYVCESWEGEPRRLSHELMETAWVDREAFRLLEAQGQLAYAQMAVQVVGLGW
ncbi:MAG: NUDIX hydrolase [Magnetococcales bacterium]|nr:NUDIX hydrolase [Magnetococcales bacterium]